MNGKKLCKWVLRQRNIGKACPIPAEINYEMTIEIKDLGSCWQVSLHNISILSVLHY